MKKHTFIAIFIFAVISYGSLSVFAQSNNLKFNNELAADFSKGLSGDPVSMERAVKNAEAILAANPKDAQTLVWLGSAMLSRAGQFYKAGNFAEGSKNWKAGRQKMDEAVAIDGENVEILMTRGTTYLSASKQFPVKEEAGNLLKLGSGDYEKIANDKNFSHFSADLKVKVWRGLAESSERLGDASKARSYYQTLSTESTGETKEKAVKWLADHQN